MTTIAELTVASPVEAWRRLGLDVDHAGWCRVGLVGLRFRAAEREPGLVGWVLTGDAPGDDEVEIELDGLATRIAAEPARPIEAGKHPVGASRIDHVVITTPSLERTCGAITAATGEPLKRVRDAGGGVRQGFHRFGEVVVEVVERPDLPGDASASFWGLVLVVDRDLHEVCAELGPEIVGSPKPAVQPGRLIATVRGSAGLGVPVALMSP